MNVKLQLLIIPFLFFLIPLYQALTNLHISFSHKEVLLILLIVIFISIFISILLNFTKNKLRIVLLSIIIFFFIDVVFLYPELLDIIVPRDYITLRSVRWLLKILILSLVFFVIYISFWNLRTHIISILSIFFLVTAITTIINQPLPKFTNLSDLNKTNTQSENLKDLPIVLHIIFDELLSPEAINLNIESGRELHSKMLKINNNFGFRNFGRIYSRHFFSAVSMPNMMNQDYLAENSEIKLDLNQSNSLSDNAYFDDMVSRGYKINVYQTTHMDFCKYKKIAECKTFDSFDPNLLLSNSSNDKLFYILLLIGRGYSGSYSGHFIDKILHKFEKFLFGYKLNLPERFDVEGFPSWFDNFIDEIKNAQRGTMIFSHFMVPHAPYYLTNDCKTDYSGSYEGYYLGEKFGYDREKINIARQKYQNEYYVQSNCVLNKITELLDNINQLPQFDDAIVIIHGDHGSRISIGKHIEDYNKDDYINNYLAFYAIRSPEIKSGYDCLLLSLPQIFSRHLNINNDNQTLNITPKSIHVASKNHPGKYIEAYMPEFKCIGDTSYSE